MATYLFIWTVLAGGTAMSGPHTYGGLHWKAQWINAGKMDTDAACHRAAASLTLAKTEYRCISAATGEAK